MKIAAYSRMLTCLLCIFYLFSCKKESLPSAEKNASEKKQSLAPLFAFHGLSGELLKTKFNGQEISVEHIGEHYVWMGDIVFDQKIFDSLKQNEVSNARTFNPNRFWNKGEVAYTIAAGFSVSELADINDAIAHWQTLTAIRFIPRSFEADYVTIYKNTGLGNYSTYLGRQGGQQFITLQTGGFNECTVIHEIGHVIGFYHEQSRTDRDNSIIINWSNIYTGKHSQFATYVQQGNSGTQIGSFDFSSAMLYPSLIADPSFAINTAIPVMTRTDLTTWPQTCGLSTGDIETAEFVYGPPYARIEYVNINYYYNGDAQSETVYSEDEVYVNLFSDRACTIPYTGQRTVVAHPVVIEVLSYGGAPTYTQSTITIPAGNNHFYWTSLVTTYYAMDFGNYYGYQSRSAYLNDAFSR